MNRTPIEDRLDVLQAAVVALAATLKPDQARLARAALRASVAEMDEEPAPEAAEAVHAVIRTLDMCG